MRRSTRRKLKRFFREHRDITGVVLAIGTILIAVLPARFWLALSLGLILLELIFVLLRRAASAPEVLYFEEVSFGEPTNYGASRHFQGLLSSEKDRAVVRAVHGLLQGEKAMPLFVHAAPINKEVDDVCQALQTTGFSTLYGGPGEGKSMTAYHAAYRLYKRAAYSPYLLKVDLLKGRSLQDQAFRDDLEAQLDSLKVKRGFNLRRKPKLIIVDDAHKLEQTERQELNQLLRDDALEGSTKVIWLETEFYEGTASERAESHIRVNFHDFVDTLVKNFYRSASATIQLALQGQTEGLDEAIRMTAEGRIRDAWHFAFVASGGQKRVEEEISKLHEADTLVLFLISAHSVISGEAELSTPHLVNLLETLQVGWLKNALREGRSFIDMVRSLQQHKFEASPDKPTAKRMPLIRLYDKTPNDRGYIASLHFNSASAIVTAALLRTGIAKDLMESLKTLLTSDYRACRYVEILLASLEPQNALEFVKANESWFAGFLSNPLPETIPQCASLLGYLKTCDTGEYRTMVDKLDLHSLARRLAGIDAGGFNALVALIDGLGHRRDEFLEKVPWQDLADQVAKADLAQFSQVVHLLNTFKGRRDALLEKVSWQEFASRLAKAEVNQFGQVVDLLHALWDRRDALLEKVSWQEFASRLAKADLAKFSQVASLLNTFKDRRDTLLEKVSWQDFADRAAKAGVAQFDQVAQLLDALGNRRDGLIDKVTWQALANRAAKAEVAQFDQVAHLLNALGDRRGALLEKVGEVAWQGLANRVANVEAAQFDRVATLLNALRDRRDALLEKVDTTSLARTANRCGGEDLRGLTMLIARLDDERRCDLIRDVDWPLLSTKCPVEASMLLTLGACLGNVWKKADMCSDLSGCQKTAAYLNGQLEALLCAVKESFINTTKIPTAYAGPAKLLSNCNRIDGEVALKIAERTIGTAVQSFWVRPASYRYIGQLINAFHEVHPELAAAFLENPKIRGRITWSLNKHDWASERPSVEHLIKAIYRASPSIWHRMRDRMAADLGGIDLDSLYAEVEGTAVGRQPPDLE